VHGSSASVKAQIQELNKYPGIKNIHTAEHDGLENPYGQSIAHIVSNLVKAKGYTQIVAATSGFGKDIIPRVGGLLDLQAITDVVEIHDQGTKFVRPIYAGNAMCKVSTSDKIKLLTVRGTNFEKVGQSGSNNYPV